MRAELIQVTIKPQQIGAPTDREISILIQTPDCSNPVYIGDKHLQPYRLMPKSEKTFIVKPQDLFIRGDGIDKVVLLIG